MHQNPIVFLDILMLLRGWGLRRTERFTDLPSIQFGKLPEKLPRLKMVRLRRLCRNLSIFRCALRVTAGVRVILGDR